MKVSLTAKQVAQLQPYFDRVRAAAQMGSPGMLVAQVSWNNNGRYWLEPAFLEHEEAKLVTEHGRDLPKLEKLRESGHTSADDSSEHETISNKGK